MRKVWPYWARCVGSMIESGAVVKVGCRKCRTVFDVDLVAIRAARGPDFSLIDATTQCKITRCRGRGYFLAARSADDVMMPLVNADLILLGLTGLKVADLEPPDRTASVPDGELV